WQGGEIRLTQAYRLSSFSEAKQRAELAQIVERRRADQARQAAWRAKPKKARSPWESNSYAAGKQRRLKRIEREATGELSKAFREGKLSLRQTDILSRLEPAKQRREVAKVLTARARRIDGERLANEAIVEMLQEVDRKQLDLGELARTIRDRILVVAGAP